MAMIQAQVTLLTQSRQVQKGRRFGGLVVNMRCRQDDDRSRDRMGFAMFSPAPFATPLPPDEPDEVTSKLPVGRIAPRVFGLDRHD
jgi:hypothetical protein